MDIGSGENVLIAVGLASCWSEAASNMFAEAAEGLLSEATEAVEERLKAGSTGIRKLEVRERVEWVLGLRLKFPFRFGGIGAADGGCLSVGLAAFLSESKRASETEEWMLGLRLKPPTLLLPLLLFMCFIAAEAQSSNASKTLSFSSLVAGLRALVST